MKISSSRLDVHDKQVGNGSMPIVNLSNNTSTPGIIQDSQCLIGTEDESLSPKPRKRQNYAKYEGIKDKMMGMLLEEKYTSSEIAETIGINHNSTYFKYKALLQVEMGFSLKSTDEIMYL